MCSSFLLSIRPYICPSKKYPLNAYHVASIVLGKGDLKVKKADIIPALMEFVVYRGKGG